LGHGLRLAQGRGEAERFPQFITTIDGLDIQFIHVRSKHENALPLIVTHGWPGSIIEQLKIIDPLTNPTAHGGSAQDAFDVVIPSMPGYGFSEHPVLRQRSPSVADQRRRARQLHALLATNSASAARCIERTPGAA
jgi:pimeloyl-ACP methyl ester carboxylesterase